MKRSAIPVANMRRDCAGMPGASLSAGDGRVQFGTLDAGATSKFLALIAEAHRREDWFTDGDPKPGRPIPVPPSISLGWRYIAAGFSIAGSAIFERIRR